MPLYEYKCECGKVKEKQFKISECKNSIKCECGKRMKKIPSIPGPRWRFMDTG